MKRLISMKNDIIVWLVIITGFLVTRLVNLTKLPIFTDEAIYIRWSQIGANDANWRFISLTDGKQPLFTWIMMLYLKVIHLDPLFVGRLVSVSAGLLSVIGIWLVTRELFNNKKIAYIASILYVISPFTLMYDRLALYDSWVACLSIWNLYLALRLVKSPALDKALIFAMTLALGMLNKSSGFFGLYLVPVTAILFDWRKNLKKSGLFYWIRLVIISAILSQVYYSVLRLSPYFHMIGQKDHVFIYSFSDWFANPTKFLIGNLKGLFDWLTGYMTLPVFILAFLPVLTFWKNPKQKFILYAYWFLPFLALALFGKVLYPRFILFMSIPLYILSSLGFFWIITNFKNRFFMLVFLAVILGSALNMSYLLVYDPIHAPVPLADRGQIMDDWPAGGGIREVNNFFMAQAANKKIAVYTDGTFGLLPYAVEIYLVNNPNVEIHGIWPFPVKIPAEISAKAALKDVYLITNQIQDKPDWPLLLIGSYQKGNRPDRSLRLYKVVSTIAAKNSDAGFSL
jgi:4-amino-4-deoxy-L-arabinose transferase-like glycosyltransferase